MRVFGEDGRRAGCCPEDSAGRKFTYKEVGKLEPGAGRVRRPHDELRQHLRRVEAFGEDGRRVGCCPEDNDGGEVLGLGCFFLNA